ncbi:MAG: PLP-dependent transferase [Armatimonadetes bacterium]|nr:PLP-dependent transferase [Armatimonadota bacterium]
MPDSSSWRPETLAQHLGEEEYILGAVTPPIFQNSTFVFENWDQFMDATEYRGGPPYHYSRMSNPTCEAAEVKIAALEGTERCKLFVSGMAAISTTILANVKAGAHVVCVDSCYGPTKQFIQDYLPKFDVSSTYVVGEDPQEIFDACRPETTLIYLESPTSIVFRLQDLEAVGSFARSKGITTAIDNTYSSPLYQNPAKFGIDYVLHTGSKYLGGHSDLIAGAMCCSQEKMETFTMTELPVLGNTLGPFQAWLVLRTLRTLHLKIKAIEQTANTVAAWLKTRPEVEQVFHVGLDDHPQKCLRDKQMSGSTGLLSFVPKDQRRESVRAMTEAMRLYRIGVSWGGHESLVVPLEFQALDWPEKKWVVRLYNGLEHPEDLIADLDQAFAKAK